MNMHPATVISDANTIPYPDEHPAHAAHSLCAPLPQLRPSSAAPIIIVRERDASVLGGFALGLGFGAGLLAMGALAFALYKSHADPQ